MKFTTIASVLALAATAVAAPADVEARTGGGGGGSTTTCSANNKQVCCNGLSCLVQVLGNTCSGDAYCCKTDAPAGTLVNVALLNCVKLL
ncbi:hypothetical protein NW762_010629 [Fusarium torreyae]|uniref:Hydrophobin 3 n=1 Tax=Fusarium torreyae TaxID=1237075 RepID=A0A9W8RT59_9HYPO|nr:hypothetical protein NW762_010629 [Fusarium torreyae]